MAPKHLFVPFVIALSQLPQSTTGREIPDTLRSFYDSIISEKSCSNKLADGFYSTEEGSDNFDYCGDYLDEFDVIYISGKGNALTNMDVDCDGAYNKTTDDGRCGSSTDTQGQTSFQYEFEEYDLGLTDLDANVHPYVVFGNVGDTEGFAEYDPKWDGVEPLSLIAVVCNNKLVYGIWGDYNGDDGDKSLVGEASISLATLCYGDNITGGNGHDEDDVLYIAFVGTDAVPGAQGANWTAGDPEIFEDSIADLGDQLVSRITGSASGVWRQSTVYCATVGAIVAVMLSNFM
ncbi:hypothetical protein MKZ38_010382 [Zalerion maritima]|uniref:Endo-chitosanase n=1 Tax=Zalerion maritima TaxID=339359 RepID=A0AAD5WT01_9PEZI|nr:hypothetical protein MKZ38_010382 [Zalerion maritima]